MYVGYCCMLILCESDFCHSFQFCFPAFLSQYIVAIPCSYGSYRVGFPRNIFNDPFFYANHFIHKCKANTQFYWQQSTSKYVVDFIGSHFLLASVFCCISIGIVSTLLSTVCARISVKRKSKIHIQRSLYGSHDENIKISSNMMN